MGQLGALSNQSRRIVWQVDGYTRFRCPTCEHERCTSCAVPWHDGLTCDMFQQWRHDEDAGDDLVAEHMEQHGFKVCHSCGQGVEKIVGCNHMRCT